MSGLLSNELLKMENDAVLPPESEITPIVLPLPAASEAAAAGGGEGGAAGGARRKKRKMDAAAAHSDSEEESEDEVGHLNGRHGHGRWDYTHDFAVPCNKTIIKVSNAFQNLCIARSSLLPSLPPHSLTTYPSLPPHPPTYLPSITQVIELLRKEWKEAIELVGAVKLWIQLSIPPIESGGQVGREGGRGGREGATK